MEKHIKDFKSYNVNENQEYLHGSLEYMQGTEHYDYETPQDLLKYTSELDIFLITKLNRIKSWFSKYVNSEGDTTTFSISVDNLKTKLTHILNHLDGIQEDIKKYTKQMDIEYIETPEENNSKTDELYTDLENKDDDIEKQKDRIKEYIELLNNLISHLRDTDDLYVAIRKFKF